MCNCRGGWGCETDECVTVGWGGGGLKQVMCNCRGGWRGETGECVNVWLVNCVC